MSGGAYCPGLELLRLDSNLDSDVLNWNPLHCLLCQESLCEPVALPCFHVFCRNCVVSGRDKDQRTKCPLCGHDWDTSDASLTCDRIVKYFIDSANEKTDLCANCDQVHQPMFFCETCQQPLCHSCKDQTHQAKMFSTHRLVPNDERSGQAKTKSCEIHKEPYILFSSDTKSLGCIMCFKKSTAAHFTDLESAHRSGVDKLEKIAKQLKTFQKEVRDGIFLHRGLLDEVRKSANAESCQIQVLCQQMIDRLIEIRDQLLSSISRECAEREEHFRHQLNLLCSLVPTVQLNVLIASIFCSSANKLDFLDLAYLLMHRIQAIMAEHQNLTPSFTAQIQTNYKAEFARALEPFLGMKSVLLPTISAASMTRQLSAATPLAQDPVFINTNSAAAAAAVGINGGGSGGELSPCGSVHSMQYSRAGSSTKRSSYPHFHRLKLMIDLAGAFGDEYNKIEEQQKELLKRFSNISRSAQEVQRDMTMRRCLVDEKRVSDVMTQCQRLKVDVGIHSSRVDDLQPIFQHIWEEELDRVRTQQETYKNHIGSVLTLREDLHRVITATEQLEPFVRSLAQVIQQIKPERCRLDDPGPMEQICLQINTLEPNSQLRVDAIERQEQQRKQEIERKKQESSSVLATVKRQLKAPPTKDHCQKRRSFTDVVVQDHVGHTLANANDVVVGSPQAVPAIVVKEVDRERVDASQVSPGQKPKVGSSGSASPKLHPRKSFMGEIQPKLGGSNASLDESFELLLSTMEGAAKQPLQKQTSISPSADHTDKDKDSDDVDSVQGKLGRSVTLSEGTDIEAMQQCVDSKPALLVSNSLPSLPSIGSAYDRCENNSDSNCQVRTLPVVIPRPPRLPASLVATVSASTLEARERVLASLKEKVPRIDIGPACNDDKD